MIGKKTKWGVRGLVLAGLLYAVHGLCPSAHAHDIAVGLAIISAALTFYGIYYRICGIACHWYEGRPDVTRSRLNRGAGGGM